MAAVAQQAADEAIQAYDNLCAELSEAIELAYLEGFEDARSDEDNESQACWKASNARRAQL
jgi:hypothetical protein